MSKFSVREEILIEPPEICPHNKIVQNIENVYRQEPPIRLLTAMHLTKLGQSQCLRCGQENSEKCPCQFMGTKAAMRLQSNNDGVEGEDIPRREEGCIFSYIVTSPFNDNEETPANVEDKSITIMDRFRQSYKKSKHFLSNPKRIVGRQRDSMIWLMKPLKGALRNSNTELSGCLKSPENIVDCSNIALRDEGKGNFDIKSFLVDGMEKASTFGRFQKAFYDKNPQGRQQVSPYIVRGHKVRLPLTLPGFNGPLNGLNLKRKSMKPSLQNQFCPLGIGKVQSQSKRRLYSLDKSSNDKEETSQHSGLKREIKSTYHKSWDLLALRKCGTVVEFFNTKIHLEDMQYRDSSLNETSKQQLQISSGAWENLDLKYKDLLNGEQVQEVTNRNADGSLMKSIIQQRIDDKLSEQLARSPENFKTSKRDIDIMTRTRTRERNTKVELPMKNDSDSILPQISGNLKTKQLQRNIINKKKNEKLIENNSDSPAIINSSNFTKNIVELSGSTNIIYKKEAKKSEPKSTNSPCSKEAKNPEEKFLQLNPKHFANTKNLMKKSAKIYLANNANQRKLNAKQIFKNLQQSSQKTQVQGMETIKQTFTTVSSKVNANKSAEVRSLKIRFSQLNILPSSQQFDPPKHFPSLMSQPISKASLNPIAGGEEAFKTSVSLSRSTAVPICYFSPINMKKNIFNNTLTKSNRTLFPHEKALFENNHF